MLQYFFKKSIKISPNSSSKYNLYPTHLDQEAGEAFNNISSFAIFVPINIKYFGSIFSFSLFFFRMRFLKTITITIIAKLANI